MRCLPNAKIAEVLFLQDRNIVCSLERQVQEDKVRRKREVVSNKDVMKCVVDTIVLLGKQGLAFRGHCESLTCTNNMGSFIAVLEFLSIYDATIRDHLEKVRQQQKSENSTGSTVKRKGTRVKKARGWGSKLTFLSNRTQNKVIDVIGKLVKSAIVKSINDCKAWALIADTTPDVSHHEQHSICVRIVDKYGYCFEHLLCCTRASGTTARSLFNTIMKALKAEGVTFETDFVLKKDAVPTIHHQEDPEAEMADSRSTRKHHSVIRGLLKENKAKTSAKTSEDTEEEISTTSPENVAFLSEPDLAVNCIYHVEQSLTTQGASSQTPECLGCKKLSSQNRQLQNKIIDLQAKIQDQLTEIQQQKGKINFVDAKLNKKLKAARKELETMAHAPMNFMLEKKPQKEATEAWRKRKSMVVQRSQGLCKVLYSLC
ncbi:Hypothetical predicted protein [Paramuricea clavata]|uniref:Uncharacterized protein n=1 Tax=Paramuricea clavata TaxID=317549 RepID=A0A7D9D4P0_PARCT|nr:Hypothetical predicted protein [Paramuricea clavata]